MSIQGWFPLGLSGLISLLSKGFSRVFSSTAVWKRQFFGVQPSLWSSSHIHTWLLEKPELWLCGLLSAKWCLWFLSSDKAKASLLLHSTVYKHIKSPSRFKGKRHRNHFSKEGIATTDFNSAHLWSLMLQAIGEQGLWFRITVSFKTWHNS